MADDKYDAPGLSLSKVLFSVPTWTLWYFGIYQVKDLLFQNIFLNPSWKDFFLFSAVLPHYPALYRGAEGLCLLSLLFHLTCGRQKLCLINLWF